MSIAAIKDRHRGRERWRRFFLLWLMIWLIGCALIVAASLGCWLLTGGNGLFDKLSRLWLPVGIHMWF